MEHKRAIILSTMFSSVDIKSFNLKHHCNGKVINLHLMGAAFIDIDREMLQKLLEEVDKLKISISKRTEKES